MAAALSTRPLTVSCEWERGWRYNAKDRWNYAVGRAGRVEDAAVDAARAGTDRDTLRQDRGRVELHLTIGDFHPLAQEVMRAGFVFAIDDAGKPQILQPDEPLVWGIDTVRTRYDAR